MFQVNFSNHMPYLEIVVKERQGDVTPIFQALYRVSGMVVPTLSTPIAHSSPTRIPSSHPTWATPLQETTFRVH